MSVIGNAVAAPERAEATTSDASTGTKEKAPRAELVKFLADGAERIATAVTPEGYNSSKHKPLGKSDFVDEPTFLLWKANEYERKAAKLRKEAETITKLGSAADRSKAKKLMTMQSRMAELAKELAADGQLNLKDILGEETYALLLGSAQSTTTDAPAAE